MSYSTTEVYATKRQTIKFSMSLVPSKKQVERRFVSDMIYGLLRGASVTLKDIGTALHEDIRIVNTIDRLSRNLQKPLSPEIDLNYRNKLIHNLADEPVFLVDDTDIIKPYGKVFEALGKVRDGSDPKHGIKPGYTVTEIVGLTAHEKQPVSFFSHIHSSQENGYISTNRVLYDGLNQVLFQLKKDSRPTFVFDRGYDMNALFQFMHTHEKAPYYVIRLTDKRNLRLGNRWLSAPTLAAARKGKIRTDLTFWDSDHSKMRHETVYISHMKTEITAGHFPIFLVLVYGLSDKPMMLATNRPIRGKKDVQKIVRLYLSRWRIEEYFRFKKQHFSFENIRVRSLQSMNNLNHMMSYAIALIGMLADQKQHSALTKLLIANAKAIRQDVCFLYYRIAQGMRNTLAYAREGIARWFKRRRYEPRQLSLFDFI